MLIWPPMQFSTVVLPLQPTGIRPQLILLFTVSEFLIVTFSYNQTTRYHGHQCNSLLWSDPFSLQGWDHNWSSSFLFQNFWWSRFLIIRQHVAIATNAILYCGLTPSAYMGKTIVDLPVYCFRIFDGHVFLQPDKTLTWPPMHFFTVVGPLQPTMVRPQLIFLFTVSQFFIVTFSYNQKKR